MRNLKCISAQPGDEDEKQTKEQETEQPDNSGTTDEQTDKTEKVSLAEALGQSSLSVVYNGLDTADNFQEENKKWLWHIFGKKWNYFPKQMWYNKVSLWKRRRTSMKGKRFLTRILACSLSFLMFLTAPADAVFAQNFTQETEEIETDAVETEIAY